MHKMVINHTMSDLKTKLRLMSIQKFGTQCMAYSALQDGIKEFRHRSFKGFIAYCSLGGVDYVLSDPITSEKDFPAATILFLEQSQHPVFCQISEKYARHLSFLNFKVNGLGIENVIRLDDFKVGWRDKKCLKSYLSKLEKQGYYVFENQTDLQRITEINDQWLKGKQKSKELKFMARPFVGIDEEDVRYFYLIKDKKIIGFCSFDPIYSRNYSGKVTSYTLQHLRVCDEAPLGSQDYLILNALFQFKEEGLKNISLGLAPLYKRSNIGFKHSKFAESIFSLIYKTNAFYNYKTIGEHKDHYKADQIQTFIATPKKFTLKQLYGLLKVNNLI